MEFLRQLFFVGVTSGQGPFLSAYLANTLEMLAICLMLAYLAVILTLLAGVYGGTERVRELIDTEGRAKLCGVWSIYAAMLIVVGSVLWIYWRGVLPPQPDLVWYLRPLSAHATVLVLLFLIWLFLHRGVRQDSKAAQRFLPVGA